MYSVEIDGLLMTDGTQGNNSNWLSKFSIDWQEDDGNLKLRERGLSFFFLLSEEECFF